MGAYQISWGVKALLMLKNLVVTLFLIALFGLETESWGTTSRVMFTVGLASSTIITTYVELMFINWGLDIYKDMKKE